MNKNLLKKLYGIHSQSGREKKMRRFIMNHAKQCGNVSMDVDEYGNLFITKGISDTYPCLAAHMDQVQSRHAKDFVAVEANGVIFGYSPNHREQQGLGADDKNGIFICLECLKKYDVLKLAFFVGEETGCEGSSQCDLTFFSDCRFIIEPDRRGASDLITSMFCGDVCSQEFIKAIKPQLYGYKEAEGSVTDVGELTERGVGISCLNLSCGYYEAHSDHEITDVGDLENCLDFVQHIIETCTDVYPFTDTWRPSRRVSYNYYYGSRYDAWREDDWYDDNCYDADFDAMEWRLKSQPELSFDELELLYRADFFTHSTTRLREIYDDVRAYLESQEEDFEEIEPEEVES